MSSGAMALMITSACIGLSGNSKEACSKAAEAGAKQSGFEQNVDTMESTVEKDANKQAHYLLGETGMDVAGGTVFIVKAVADKAVKFNPPTFGICDKITNQLGPDKYTILFEWKF